MEILTMATKFTCNTCRVAFREALTQREHYKSEWHRYNLKRKVAELPPVTSEDFLKRVQKQQSLDVENEKDKSIYCTTCRKNFSCTKSYENHLNSKRHQEREENAAKDIKKVASMVKEVVLQKQKKVESKKMPDVESEIEDIETDSEVEEISSDEWNEDDENNPVNKDNCLFCNHHSANLVMNIKHMSEFHSFFIPDVEYCVDLRGLLLYLGAKISNGFMCLWCNEKSKNFQSMEAAQRHMIDKGHTNMYHEGEAFLEYTSYYDYSSSYPDNDGQDPDEEVNIPELDDTGYQLILPSGTVIGHRSLMRYYKQNLNPKNGIALRQKVNQVLSTYKQFGYTQLEKEIAQRKARDIRYMQRAHQKYYSQIGCKANKLQRYFRPQVNF